MLERRKACVVVMPAAARRRRRRSGRRDGPAAAAVGTEDRRIVCRFGLCVHARAVALVLYLAVGIAMHRMSHCAALRHPRLSVSLNGPRPRFCRTRPVCVCVYHRSQTVTTTIRRTNYNASTHAGVVFARDRQRDPEDGSTSSMRPTDAAAAAPARLLLPTSATSGIGTRHRF